MKFLLFVWQLPQNILGFLYSLIAKKQEVVCNDQKKIKVYITKLIPSGISLGNYIILNRLDMSAVNHEHGHQKQSMYLGWLYLIVVGLPSITRNIYDVCKHKGWSYENRVKWYYGHYPEHWADKLGGVHR